MQYRIALMFTVDLLVGGNFTCEPSQLRFLVKVSVELIGVEGSDVGVALLSPGDL